GRLDPAQGLQGATPQHRHDVEQMTRTGRESINALLTSCFETRGDWQAIQGVSVYDHAGVSLPQSTRRGGDSQSIDGDARLSTPRVPEKLGQPSRRRLLQAACHQLCSLLLAQRIQLQDFDQSSIGKRSFILRATGGEATEHPQRWGWSEQHAPKEQTRE